MAWHPGEDREEQGLTLSPKVYVRAKARMLTVVIAAYMMTAHSYGIIGDSTLVLRPRNTRFDVEYVRRYDRYPTPKCLHSASLNTQTPQLVGVTSHSA